MCAVRGELGWPLAKRFLFAYVYFVEHGALRGGAREEVRCNCYLYLDCPMIYWALLGDGRAMGPEEEGPGGREPNIMYGSF